MFKTIGIFAHVDGGKTTFSEQLLYKNGSIRNLGRVDNQTAFLDCDNIEKERGITVFAEQASFDYNENKYYIIDTPGHTDFSPEAERTMSALDYAILIINGSDGVQAHTVTLFRLLENYGVPVFIFVNKCDITGFSIENTLESIREKLTEDVLFIDDFEDISKDENKEFIAERNEDYLSEYLDGGGDEITAIKDSVKNRNIFVAMKGSALKDIGIDQFFSVFDKLTFTDYSSDGEFCGEVFKIRYDSKGLKVAYIKGNSGTIGVKETIGNEKINEIRFYKGEKYENSDKACGGQIFGVTGLNEVSCGDIIKNGKIIKNAEKYTMISALQSKVNILDGTDSNKVMECLKMLENQEPMLRTEYIKQTNEIVVSVMGKIQLEVLQEILSTRFGISATFEKPEVQYRETVAETVIGYGHYEPLRHYAEVVLEIAPAERNSGITFDSTVHIDVLSANYQALVKTHIFEKQHKGILTGSPLTDVKIKLINGRAHLKHTEGGDFRQATYRAIRQGLEKAENVILEPFYAFEIYAGEEYAGRIMTDIQRLRGSFEPPVQMGNTYKIKGRGPVETFMDYQEELLSFTKGTGSIVMTVDGYEKCEIADEVIEKINYNKGEDKENTSCSVFCSHGAGFTVNWDEAESYMHTLK